MCGGRGFAGVWTTATPVRDYRRPPKPLLPYPRAFPLDAGQRRIHAEPERTRPLTGAGIEATPDESAARTASR